MLQRWRSGSPWGVGTGAGALFAVGLLVFFALQGLPWVAALAGALVGGVFFGAVMGPWAVRQQQQARAALGGSPETYRAASRSLRWRSPLPDSGAERAAAVVLARQRLQVLDGQRVWGTLVFLAIAGVAVWLALTRSPWWWLEVFSFGIVIVVSWLQRRRLHRIVAAA